MKDCLKIMRRLEYKDWKKILAVFMDNTKTGRKYLQITIPRKGYYPKHTENSQNSTVRKLLATLKNGPKTLKIPHKRYMDGT